MSPVLRRVCFAVATLLIGCSAAGCDRSHEGEINVLVIGELPKKIDPADGPLTAPQAVILASVAQGLVQFDARGQIEPGLAERWNVTDDGLSYIFRLRSAEWPTGGKITAQQVARLLRRQLGATSKNSLKDTLGAVGEIVPMTDRVIEIRLKAPRPNLLQLLAQPEFGILREGRGTGPFQIGPAETSPGQLHLEHTVSSVDGEETLREELVLGAATAPLAVRAFLEGKTDLVLGGTYADLPYARAQDMPRNALRFDPASGLFGLVPARQGGPLSDPELRALLSQAVNRQALIDALDVPGLLPRATVLEPRLDGVSDPVAPEWSAVPIEQRAPELAARATRFVGGNDPVVVRIALPDAPGAQLLLRRLSSDWAPLGFRVELARKGQVADFRLIDSVAPSTSPAWFLRQFRCGEVPNCDPEIDRMLDEARAVLIPAQRNGLLAQAARRIDEQQLFIALAAPIRWSLVSERVLGFATNRFALHTLLGLRDRLNRERQE